MARSPVRATTVRPSAEAPEKKVRIRKGGSMRSLLDVPQEMLDKLTAMGIDLQWVTDSVLGQPSPQNRMAYEINCWEPVTPDMFDGMFDGMYSKRGHKGEINYEGLVLMWRPLELTLEARAEDMQARNNQLSAQANMLKSGQIPGFSPGFEPDHPTAISRNVLTRSVKAPMEIPRD